MSDGTWQLVFEVGQKSGEKFAFFIAAGVAIGVLALVGLMALRDSRRQHSLALNALAYVVLGGAVFAASTSVWWITHEGSADEIARAVDLASVVEGPVENFVPMPYQGHSLESFDVAGVHFAYSDYVLTSGFNNTSSHGGPIRQGLYVRIHYVRLGRSEDANSIVRLEIRR